MKIFLLLLLLFGACANYKEKGVVCSHSNNVCQTYDSLFGIELSKDYWKIPLYQISGFEMRVTKRSGEKIYTIYLKSDIRVIELFETNNPRLAKEKLNQEKQKFNAFMDNQTNTYEFEPANTKMPFYIWGYLIFCISVILEWCYSKFKPANSQSAGEEKQSNNAEEMSNYSEEQSEHLGTSDGLKTNSSQNMQNTQNAQNTQNMSSTQNMQGPVVREKGFVEKLSDKYKKSKEHTRENGWIN